jgi:hypothetical protein
MHLQLLLNYLTIWEYDMYYRQVDEINADISRTRRAIVTLGCSFVQGQGAVDDSLYEEYKWHYERVGVPISITANEYQKQEIIKKYPTVELNPFNNKLDFTFMEYKNAFGNVLAKKYFDGKYASINLGIRGSGNRATIKELYFHPEIHWHKLDEIIVIYCPSGLERFDFVNDAWNGHNHFATMWPHYQDPHLEDGPRKKLSEGYAKRLYSDKFQIIEQISHSQELLTWCKLNAAKLIITPAFDRRYNREYFTSNIFTEYGRDMEGRILNINEFLEIDPLLKNELNNLIELWPWDNMFFPENFPTFVDICMAQEFPETWENEHFFQYNGKFTPQRWITSCAHPSAKGHDLFAKKLFEYIESKTLFQ